MRVLTTKRGLESDSGNVKFENPKPREALH
jgi:hypothetical protein